MLCEDRSFLKSWFRKAGQAAPRAAGAAKSKTASADVADMNDKMRLTGELQRTVR
jgi:Holliday junction resolvase